MILSCVVITGISLYRFDFHCACNLGFLVQITVTWKPHTEMPMMPCGCRKLQQRNRLCLRIPELAGNPPPSLLGCRWSLLILKCRRLMCSFNISLQHHKEDKHLGSKNTFFSDDPRRRKSDEWNYTANGSPFILRCPPCKRSTVFTATPHLLQRYWYSYGNATLYYYNNINK